MTLTALERLQRLEGNVQPNVNVQLDLGKPEPWIDIDYPASRDFISRGRTNVLGEMSDVVNRAMRLYPSDDDLLD